MSITEQLRAIVGDRLKLAEPMAKHVNFRIGGPAARYAVVESADEAEKVVAALAASGTPWTVLGGGSNVLVNDKGYDGTIVQMAMRRHAIDGETVVADAGVLSAFLARATVEAGLAGFAWAIGLPGTVGGATRGNAGCYGGEMKDAVVSADLLVVRDGAVARETWDAATLAFGYRDSAIKRAATPPVVLSVTLKLAKGDVAAEKVRMAEILASRKEKQPLESSSAGCIFTNLVLTGDEDLSRLRQDADIPPEFLATQRIGAGWLIEQAGLKGFAIGDARVSDKHGNFCVNAGHATAEQVMELIAAIKSKVRQKYGLQLMEEVQYLGF